MFGMCRCGYRSGVGSGWGRTPSGVGLAEPEAQVEGQAPARVNKGAAGKKSAPGSSLPNITTGPSSRKSTRKDLNTYANTPRSPGHNRLYRRRAPARGSHARGGLVRAAGAVVGRMAWPLRDRSDAGARSCLTWSRRARRPVSDSLQRTRHEPKRSTTLASCSAKVTTRCQSRRCPRPPGSVA